MKTLKILLVAALLAFPFTGCKKDKSAAADQAGEMAASPAGGDALADLDKILEKQKALFAAMKTLKTLDDLKARKDEYVKGSVEVFEMQLASLRKAAALPKEQLKAYAEKAKKLQEENAQLGKDMMALQEELMKIAGAKELIMSLQTETQAKLKPLADEFVKLQKDIAEKIK